MRNLRPLPWPIRLIAVVLALVPTIARADLPAYASQRIGFWGPGYVNAQGTSVSSLFGVSATGTAFGRSSRFNATGAARGFDAWVAVFGGATSQVGFVTAPYVRSDGWRDSTPLLLSSTGFAVGVSNRYSVFNSSGNDAWIWSPTTGSSIRIGLSGSTYEQPSGFRDTLPQHVNASGVSAGFSSRYSGTATRGQDAWVSSPDGAAQQVGLMGAGYETTNGTRFSSVDFLNSGGAAVGFTRRCSATSDGLGRDVWYATPGGPTTRVGPTGTEYVDAGSGVSSSTAVALNSSGQVAGYTGRSGVGGGGQDSWVTQPGGGSATLIGLRGPGYTSATGERNAYVQFLAATGATAGDSQRFDGTTFFGIGYDSWITSPSGATTRVGLDGPGYLDNSGERYSHVQFFTQSERAAGYTVRRNAIGSTQGFDCWVTSPSGGTTYRVGLQGAAYTRPFSGYSESRLKFVSETGYAAGFTFLEVPSGGAGADAWVSSPLGVTTRVGLSGGVYELPDGSRLSEVHLLNNVGQAAGTSRRHVGNFSATAAWFYDPATELTTELLFSVRADGFATTFPTILTDGGVVLGSYQLFQGGTDLGLRAFWWKSGAGFTDLGALVDGGLSNAGWLWLDRVLQGSGLNADGSPVWIGGAARAIGESAPGSVYLLGPVPTPPACGALMLCSWVLVRRSRAAGRSCRRLA